MDGSLTELLTRQEALITRSQALTCMSEDAVRHRLRGQWQILLPGVYLTVTGTPTPRQGLRAALLYGGSTSQLTDATALEAYDVRYLPKDPTVRLLLPAEVRRANRDGVTVRRSHRLPAPRLIHGLPCTPPDRALVEFAARVTDRRTSVAVIADAVQRNLALPERLAAEVAHVTGRGGNAARQAVATVIGGVRSAPEADFVSLCRLSTILPPPMLNSLIVLPCGRRVSPDALWEQAALVHETNGREFHAGHDDFDSMQERHDAMTAAGLTVLHSSPRQLRDDAARVVAQVEACYLRGAGKGLPPGIVILRRDAAA